MPAYAGIQFLDSGFRRNDDTSVGVLNPIGNQNICWHHGQCAENSDLDSIIGHADSQNTQSASFV